MQPWEHRVNYFILCHDTRKLLTIATISRKRTGLHVFGLIHVFEKRRQPNLYVALGTQSTWPSCFWPDFVPPEIHRKVRSKRNTTRFPDAKILHVFGSICIPAEMSTSASHLHTLDRNAYISSAFSNCERRNLLAIIDISLFTFYFMLTYPEVAYNFYDLKKTNKASCFWPNSRF